MVHEFFGIHGPRFFGIQCPTIFCDFGLFNRLAQAGGGGLLYDISLPKTYRPKLLVPKTSQVQISREGSDTRNKSGDNGPALFTDFSFTPGGDLHICCMYKSVVDICSIREIVHLIQKPNS